jgi:hypothetical protein
MLGLIRLHDNDMKNTMKVMCVLAWLFAATMVRGADCETEVQKGLSGGTNLVFVHLEPGVTNIVTWDFTQCWFGISQFTFHTELLHGNNIKDIQAHAINITTGNVAPEYPTTLNRFLGDVGFSFLELTLILDPDARHAVDVQVITTAGFGG